MKLTWFGGGCLRVYAGGQIVVLAPEMAPAAVDRGELLAGAGRIVGAREVLPTIDGASWRPQAMPRLLEDTPAAEVARIGDALLVAVAGEPALIVLGAGELPRFGRWADGAVLVVTRAREGLVTEIAALLDAARLRLLVLAVDEQTLDAAVAALAGRLDGTGLVSLEAGLALEV